MYLAQYNGDLMSNFQQRNLKNTNRFFPRLLSFGKKFVSTITIYNADV